MGEIIAALVTTLDIFVIYLFLKIRKHRFKLALWTALLNVSIPFIGFLIGQLSIKLFADWSTLLSSVLLSLIGLHMFLQDGETSFQIQLIPPAIIAFIVSIDAFSVSVTLGMLQFNKVLFLIASGVFSFIFSLIALYLQSKLRWISDKWIRKVAGFSLIIIGILSFIG